MEHNLKLACPNGDEALVQLIIVNNVCDWNHGLYAACSAVHSKFVKSLINNGASNWSKLSKSFLNSSMIRSDLVQLMITKGADYCQCHRALTDHK